MVKNFFKMVLKILTLKIDIPIIYNISLWFTNYKKQIEQNFMKEIQTKRCKIG